jgi:hypothetical protein
MACVEVLGVVVAMAAAIFGVARSGGLRALAGFLLVVVDELELLVAVFTLLAVTTSPQQHLVTRGLGVSLGVAAPRREGVA